MTTQFIIAYDLREGATFTCKVDAPNWDEAERHLLAIASTGRVVGEYDSDVPVQEPVGWMYRTCGETRFAEKLNTPGMHRTDSVPIYTAPPDDTALLRQVLNDICGAKLCEVNSMSSRAEARRLLDKATNALRERLGETK